MFSEKSAGLKKSSLSRREFIASSATAGVMAGMLAHTQDVLAGQKTKKSGLKIAKIERGTIRLPFREVPRRNMDREIPHWRYSEIFQVTLGNGVVGLGETLLYYTWGVTKDEDVARAQGKNAVDLMWEDSLGAGLQMALFDAVAKSAEVPIHRLFGHQIHEKTPLAWWNIDTSAEDMVSECLEAKKQGYNAYKSKGRPWFDIWKQAELVGKSLPDDFVVNFDFNDTLLTAERGMPIIKRLAEYPQIKIYETPIPQGDVKGNQLIKEKTRVKIAMHYGNPAPLVAVKEDVCDGFVIGRGATSLTHAASVAALADKPFWLQLVGTGITAAYSLHYGAVCSHATWPAVNCHQLFEDNTLIKPITVTNGFADVPTGPGLGYELNWDVVDKFRVNKPPRRPEPPRIIETTWPDGRKMYIANNGRVNFMLTLGQKGTIPYFEKGVTSRLYPNDGSEAWKELHAKASKKPVMM